MKMKMVAEQGEGVISKIRGERVISSSSTCILQGF